ncbi:MAG: triphosphoribosyl-dephospho-CoA synthase [Planctomycetota bacterium]
MADPLELIASACRDRADAIHFACVLEATAPKVGNVHPAASFDDLQFSDFVIASRITSGILTTTESGIGDRVFETVQQTRLATSTNVNLGIVLLLAPLVAIEERGDELSSPAMETFLRDLPADQGRQFGNAIAASMAGGLLEDAPTSLSHLTIRGGSEVDANFDLIDAMQQASARDDIARQYTTYFHDCLNTYPSILEDSIAASGDILSGICRTHVRLLAEQGDSLIERKNGRAMSERVQAMAVEVSSRGTWTDRELDEFLRSTGHRLNPGTTADLIAASLYVLLRRRCS